MDEMCLSVGENADECCCCFIAPAVSHGVDVISAYGILSVLIYLTGGTFHVSCE